MSNNFFAKDIFKIVSVLAVLLAIIAGNLLVPERVSAVTMPYVHPSITPTPSNGPLPPALIFSNFPAYFYPVNSSVSYDSNGIPMVKYNGVLQYNPVTIEQKALYVYNVWVTKNDKTARANFFKFADWLVANQQPNGLWYYDFAFEGQPVPWWSAMAQGQGISVLVRAYAALPQEKYKIAATNALNTFTRPISDHGVMSSDNGTWYEEYLPPAHPHVLNGMIFAIVGLKEYNQQFNDSFSKSLWDTGVVTLVNNLSRFDSGSWSYYDTNRYVASLSYHKLHISLLNTMYSLTGHHTFNDYRARFQKYLNNR
jgi:heparosan-N-sulfate-glucuronate 5-epimerase